MEHRSWAIHVRRLVGIAAIAAILTGTTAPAFAAHPDKTSPPVPPPPSASLSPSVATSPFAPDAIARALAATPAGDVVTPVPAPATAPAKAPQASDGFFKSRTGVIVLAIFAVGAGYAIYSAKEDRIHGRNR